MSRIQEHWLTLRSACPGNLGPADIRRIRIRVSALTSQGKRSGFIRDGFVNYFYQQFPAIVDDPHLKHDSSFLQKSILFVSELQKSCSKHLDSYFGLISHPASLLLMAIELTDVKNDEFSITINAIWMMCSRLKKIALSDLFVLLDGRYLKNTSQYLLQYDSITVARLVRIHLAGGGIVRPSYSKKAWEAYNKLVDRIAADITHHYNLMIQFSLPGSIETLQLYEERLVDAMNKVTDSLQQCSDAMSTVNALLDQWLAPCLPMSASKSLFRSASPRARAKTMTEPVNKNEAKRLGRVGSV